MRTFWILANTAAMRLSSMALLTSESREVTTSAKRLLGCFFGAHFFSTKIAEARGEQVSGAETGTRVRIGGFVICDAEAGIRIDAEQLVVSRGSASAKVVQLAN